LADNHVQFWPACAQGFGGQANCRYTIRSYGMGCVVAVRENGKSREAWDRLAAPGAA